MSTNRVWDDNPPATISVPPARAPQQARSIFLRAEPGLTVTQITQDGFWFPVAPAEYQVGRGAEWGTLRIIKLGEVAHPAGPSLMTFGFSSFFPSLYDPYVCGGLRGAAQFRSPAASCDLLTEIMEKNDVVRLTIGIDTLSELVRVVSFSWSEVAGRGEDRLYEVQMGGWQPQSISVGGRTRVIPVPKTYTARAGEDLVDVSVRFYGTGANWKKIAVLNKITTGPKIPAGKMTLKLPAG